MHSTSQEDVDPMEGASTDRMLWVGPGGGVVVSFMTSCALLDPGDQMGHSWVYSV